MIKGMRGVHKPKHLFKDVTHRVPIEADTYCKNVVAESMAKLKGMTQKYKDGVLDGETFQLQKDELGQDMFIKLDTCLSRVKFKKTQY